VPIVLSQKGQVMAETENTLMILKAKMNLLTRHNRYKKWKKMMNYLIRLKIPRKKRLHS